MRKHTARHWLHAVLDLLPVLLIPVFMIYSHRHTMTEQTQVDIQYKYQSNEVNSVNDLVVGNIYHFHIEDDNLISYIPYDEENMYFSVNFININYYDFSQYNISFEELLKKSYENNGFFTLNLELMYDSTNINIFTTYNQDNDYLCSFSTNSLDGADFTLDGDFIFIESHDTNIVDINYLITITDYNVIESVDVQVVNSSIMNVFMDNFNTAVDKYFNMGNVFNMTNVYQWFNTNIFGGNAPVVIYSVWNIVLYEFVMDLLFLLYGLFMWFIDMCKRLMEKPLDSIK